MKTNNHNNSGKSNILVMGIGNFLMGDEGVGVHFIHQYKSELERLHVHILDGGTGGFHLMGILEEYPMVILLDATMDGFPPGTINKLKPRFSTEFPSALSAHDIGLKDLVEGLIIRDKLPEICLITISINEIQPMTVGLTDEVKKSFPKVFEEVKNVIEGWKVEMKI